MEKKDSSWSWQIARIADIEVRVHLTFFLVLLWIALSVWRQTANIAAVAQGIVFVLSLFACVVLHEFGHALTARRFGIRTRRITLLPIGGVASMERLPRNALQEILVALAGPAVNLVIAAALALFIRATGLTLPEVSDNPGLLFTDRSAFLYNLMVINLILAVFNLVPAFPMDGGRVLRATLAFFMPHHLATQRAAGIGQTLAVVMFVLGLLHNPILMLVSVFIWLAAAGEAATELLEYALHDTRAQQLMNSALTSLPATATLHQARELVIHHGQERIPVQTSQGWALLDQARLLKALHLHDDHAPVTVAELEILPTASAHTPADKLLDIIKQNHRAVAIVDGDTLCGIVTLEELNRWIQFSTDRKDVRPL